MKRIISIISVILLFAVLFVGCSKDVEDTGSKSDEIERSMNRLNYNYDMAKYVQLDSYKIEVDSESEVYQDYFNGKLREMMKEKKTEGVVAEGDVANIDYVGKKDGVAFEGGTDKGYDLEIGSDSFIEGFEDGLIGVAVGSTVDLDLTFPSNYGNAELAGKAVVFTVTVNYVTVSYDRVNNETATACGYTSAQEVMDIAAEYAFEETALDTVYSNARIDTYPDKEFDIFYTEQINSFKRAAANNSMSFESFAAYNGMTVTELEDYVKENHATQMANSYTLCYYIIDAAGEKITDELVDDMKKELDQTAGQDVAELGISRNYIEAEAVKALAEKIIIENATLKEK